MFAVPEQKALSPSGEHIPFALLEITEPTESLEKKT